MVMMGLLGRSLITRTSLLRNSTNRLFLTKPFAENDFAFSKISSKIPNTFSEFPSVRLYMWSSFIGPTGQKNIVFIWAQSTPNPLTIKLNLGKPVMEAGSADFPNAHSAMISPLAKALFEIDGITRVFFGSDFVTVTNTKDASCDFHLSGKPLFLDSSTVASMDKAIQEDDSETVAMIKQFLETRIRPALQGDGGNIEYRGFDADTGVLKLKIQGACNRSSFKSGIENMLMHYVPEVKSVEHELDEDEDPV